ncbi:hypothetical protein Tco_0216624 [Tanacetum coccineum]
MSVLDVTGLNISRAMKVLRSGSVPQAEEGATPSHNVSREEVAAPSHSQDIPDVQVEVPSQKATIEDVEVPSNIASTAQHTASSFKKVGTRKKRLGSKGVHTSRSTIPIEEGDPEAEHKVCIKYASDADSASDDDTPVNLYAVVDWELLPTGLGSINAFYRLDNSRKYFTSLREILHLVTRADLMTIYGRVMSFYQDTKAEGVGLVLWGDLKVLMDSPEVNDGSDVWKNQHTWNIQSWKLYSFSGIHVLETVSGLVLHMFVDKKYPLSVNLIEMMLDHQLEICHGSVGNELTIAVQLIAFLKKQISNSQRHKIHAWLLKQKVASPTLRKRVRFASPTPSHEVGESSAAGAARQDGPAVAREDPYSVARGDLYGFVDMVDVAPGHPMSRELDYGITDTWDDLVGAIDEIAPTTLEGVNQRVTDLATIVEQETTSMYGIMEDAQDDRSQLRGRVNLLYRDRPVHRRLAVMIEREAKMAREAWGLSMDASDYARSDVMSLRTTVVAQSALISELQSADHRRQRVISELLASDHKRQVQLTKTLRLLKGLQTQMVEFQRQHGPAKGPAQPDAPGEAVRNIVIDQY